MAQKSIAPDARLKQLEAENLLRAEVKSRRFGDRTITDYTVITACDSGALVESVFEHIEEGWQPFGAVGLSYERNIHRVIGQHDKNLPNDFEHYTQALVRYD